MRKSVAILLLVVYIISASGVAIRAHYCCGKLKSINLVLDSSSDQKEPCHGVKVTKDCCKDKVATNTITSDQKAPNSIISDNSLKDVLDCVSVVSHGFFEAYDDDADSCSTAYASPPPSARDIYLAIRVLRV